MRPHSTPPMAIDASKLAESDSVPLVKALGLATVRRIRRLHKVHCELAETQTAVVSAEELILLEDHGFIVDFDTGMAIDVSEEVSA